MTNWTLFSPCEKDKSLILTALESMEIANKGYYEKDGQKIPLLSHTEDPLDRVIPYSPKDLSELDASNAWCANARQVPCRIRVETVDSFVAASTLPAPALVLSCGNPLRPGGGVYLGASNQEECLCRASTLFCSISEGTEMYAYNEANPSLLGSDFMLLSPNVKVFRTPYGDLMDNPFDCAVITAAAPDRAVAARDVAEPELRTAIYNRLRYVCMIAVYHRYHSLVLPAFGCGAFKNPPELVAEVFQSLLTGEFKGYFNDIIFAIPNPETASAFRNYLT